MSAAESQVPGPELPPEEIEREQFLRTLDTFPVSEDLDDPVNTDVALDHYLEQLRERESEIERNAQIMTRRMAMIQAWERDANGRIERECQWLRQMIEALGRQYDFGKKKSRALPNGTFGFRAKPATLEITDPTAALAFAEANGLPIKKSVGVTPLKEHFKATGEIPDGCEYVEPEETFYVRAGG